MANIKIPREEFEKHLKLTKEIETKIPLMGVALEKVDNEEIELEIFPNRPDLLSMQGFLRSFCSFIGKNKNKEYKIKKSNYQIKVEKSVEKIRPFSMAAVLKNVEFTDEKIKDIMQWQEKVHATIGRNRKKVAIGYYVLDKINWPVTYLAEKPKDIEFEPLDLPQKMNGLQILQRHPTGREYAYQLEGFEKFPVYKDAKGEVLSMPPIINSNSLGKITPGTANILVECSGSDLDILKKVISMATVDLIDCGGEAYAVEVIYSGKKEAIGLQPEKIKIELEHVNKLLGIKLKEEEIKKLLEKMGYSYSKGIAEIPAWRTDIMHEVDLIEDIAIAYGYENFKPEIPSIATIGEISKREVLKKKIADILIGLNMTETSSYHLLSADEIKKLGKTKIEVEKSKSEYKYLRDSILKMLLKTLSENVDSSYPQRIFEIGKVFFPDNTQETGIEEKEQLAIAIASQNSGFTEIKQVLDYIMKMLNLNITIENSENQNFINGRCGKIILNNKEIGHIGEISPQMLSNLKIKMPISALKIDLGSL